MTIPDWYTGSDTSGRVAACIESTIERMDAHTADHTDIDQLRTMLDLEQESNWRSFLLGLIGTIHYDLDEVDRATPILRDSIAAYRPFNDSFDEVLSVYCQSCFTLGSILHDSERYGDAVPYLLRCLPYMHEVYDEPFVGNIFALLELCLRLSGEHRLALPFSEAAVYSRPGSCESLEHLMVAYGSCSEVDKATEVFQHITARCQEYEHMDRVLEYAADHLGDSGVVN